MGRFCFVWNGDYHSIYLSFPKPMELNWFIKYRKKKRNLFFRDQQLRSMVVLSIITNIFIVFIRCLILYYDSFYHSHFLSPSLSLTLLHFTLCVYFDNMLSSFMEVIFFNEQSSINDWIKLNKSNRLCLFFAYSKITSHVKQRDEPLINWIVKLVFINTRQWLEFSQFCFAIEKVNTIKNRHKQQLHFTEIWIRYT